MSKTILWVDDDRMVLNALERTFFESEYATLYSLTAADALNLLASRHIDMVVSDIRMAPVSGCEFLREVRQRFPKVIRLVLSAYGDRPTMIKVICEGLAKVYLLKPWDNQALISQIGTIFSLYDSLERLRSEGIVTLEKHLPVLPERYLRILRMIEEERSLKEIAAEIEIDAPCTANVLKLVNSSFFGLSVGSVHQALVYLGVDSIKDIVLVSELFKTSTAVADQDLRTQLNQHMVHSSRLLHGLHQHLCGSRIPEEFSVAGLLADIGRLLLVDSRPDQVRSLLQRFRDDPSVSFVGMEKGVFGCSHTETGALVLDWWNMPACLIEASLYHHEHSFENRTLPREILALIHIADHFAWQEVEEIANGPVVNEAAALFSVTGNELADLCRTVLNRKGAPE